MNLQRKKLAAVLCIIWLACLTLYKLGYYPIAHPLFDAIGWVCFVSFLYFAWNDRKRNQIRRLPCVDQPFGLAHSLVMRKTITIDDEVYKALSSLKRNKQDSFTEVIRRYSPHQCETAGELLDAYEVAPLPKINWDALDKIPAGRGRRSGGRK